MKLDINRENQICKIDSPKMNAGVTVQKRVADHHFFEIIFGTGTTPQELQGRYSSLDKGIKAVESYLSTRRPTASVRRDTYSKERKLNGSKNRTEGSKHIREGSDN